jgi:hypothetical protein
MSKKLGDLGLPVSSSEPMSSWTQMVQDELDGILASASLTFRGLHRPIWFWPVHMGLINGLPSDGEVSHGLVV